MTVKKMAVEKTSERVKALMTEEKALSPAFKFSLEALVLLVAILAYHFGLNSKNRSKAPSGGGSFLTVLKCSQFCCLRSFSGLEGTVNKPSGR